MGLEKGLRITKSFWDRLANDWQQASERATALSSCRGADVGDERQFAGELAKKVAIGLRRRRRARQTANNCESLANPVVWGLSVNKF